jgi:Sodium/calcium exchanger protein
LRAAAVTWMGENDRLVMHGSNGHAHGVEVGYGAGPLWGCSTMSMSSLARHESLPSLRGTCMGKLRDLVAKGIVAYSSPINWLLLFVPAGYLAAWLQLGPTVMFLANFIGMVPLALLLSRATEDIAERTSQTFGALLNVTLGNAVELIISISALRAGQLRLIQNTLVGSILSNLLLVLGSAFFVRSVGDLFRFGCSNLHIRLQGVS